MSIAEGRIEASVPEGAVKATEEFTTRIGC